MSTIRVLIVDDHAIVREGVCALLDLSPEVEVVGEAVNGRESLAKVRQLEPHVVLMDIAMPIMDGLEATRRLTQTHPNVKILVLTQYNDKEYVFPIIEAGAMGFLSKTAASSELLTAIRAVNKGNSFLSPSIARFLVDAYRSDGGTSRAHDAYDDLTKREREVLKLLAEGYTAREIAEMLGLSIKTIDGYRSNLMGKLDLHNRVELVKYALRKGITTLQ